MEKGAKNTMKINKKISALKNYLDYSLLGFFHWLQNCKPIWKHKLTRHNEHH
jgi:hypothetical protein